MVTHHDAPSLPPNTTTTDLITVSFPYPSATGLLPCRWLLILLFLLLYTLDLAIPRAFWVQDEARYGEVVREMVTEGHWLIPSLGGHPYPDKPAPYFWLVAGVGGVVGQGELPFRLVTLASTAAAALGVYLVALRLLGTGAAFWSTVVFLTSFLTLIVGHIMRMDMLLTAVSVHAWHSLLCFYQRRERPGWLVAFWGFTVLGLMVKGPIAFLFTIVPALIWMACEEGGRGIRALRLGAGFAVIMLLVGVWIGLVEAMGQGAYLWQIWREQLVGRAVESWSHREPVWFYLALLPLLGMPWSAWFPVGLRELSRDQPLAFRSLLSFTLLPFVGLSLVSGKLFLYLEPVCPGLSIVVGSVVALRIASQERVLPSIGWSPFLFFGVLAVGVGWGSVHYLGSSQGVGLAVTVVLFAFTVVSAAVARATEWRWMRTQLCLSVAFSWLIFVGLMVVMDPLYSARSLGDFVRTTSGNAPVGICCTTRGVLDYYTGRTLIELPLGQVNAWRAAHPEAWLIVPSAVVPTLSGNTCRIHRTFLIEMKEYHVFGGC